MSRSSSGFVAGLTAAALAAVGFLAYQASASAPDDLNASPDKSPTVPSSSPKDKDPLKLPAASGKGKRVVYSLAGDRVWLVGDSGKVKRTYRVTPSTVDPVPGSYAVNSRTGQVIGSDGVLIEHVVRFTSVNGIAVGFSAALNGSTSKPDPAKKTGGIRSSRADGNAMWDFALRDTKVVVIK
ncbi:MULTISPECIES: hypothetical protein [Streptomyces]|uniref:hypothetical protein n=1 Tax=Streptomyces TaxID=1883 RepID=UPI0013DAA414|nr:hypothetical protein [Streptomyces aureoverticillatus]QIB44083.1 hypothetical protein G3H79_14335 [Streptomyces aureoverticillatus]